MNGHLDYPIHPHDAVSNIAVDVLLTLLTCGIYNLFWQARQFRVLNAFLGRVQFGFWSWFFLSIITCGIYHIYNQYAMAQSIMDIQASMGRRQSDSLAIISLILTLAGLPIAADAIQQHEINRFFEE